MTEISRQSQLIPSFVLGLLFFISGTGLRAELKLAGLFGDNMILQRDSSAPVWGTADPGDTITLTLGRQKAVATADGNGNWKAVFHGLTANSGQPMTIAGKTNSITLNNVAVGDIWVCSGQSNMDYRLGDKDEIAVANNPNLRYYAVPNVATIEPANEVKGSWTVASPFVAPGFSAVAYYFGKDIQSQEGVPVGLIRCPWGGMVVESFIPLEDLESVPGLKGKSDQSMQRLKSLSTDAAKFPADFKAWQDKFGRGDSDNKGFAAGWASPTFDPKDWTPTTAPTDWINTSIPQGGIVWLRKTVQLPPEAAGQDIKFNPGNIHETATIYFDGELVTTTGSTSPYYWNDSSLCTIPGHLVKAGDNVVALRIVSQKQKDSVLSRGPALGFHVAGPNAVTDEWLAKVETEYPALPDGALASMPAPPGARAESTASGIYNGMINPLISYGIKGAIWYQGESNVFHPWPYRTLLPLLIKSWRTKWNIGDFPFYIVQLPNFGIAPTGPGQGDVLWPELREAQLLAWQKTPNTGMAVTIDIGDPKNIHPANKKDVGYRLSLIALANAYGQKIEYSGPIYDSMTIEGSKARIKFTHLGGGLVAKDGPLKQFIICGADKKWVAADAVIDGDSVVVSSPDVAIPTTVRYAWAGNPEGCNLYNKSGLPAAPFRTDDWPITFENRW